MHSRSTASDPPTPRIDDYVSYTDGAALVICARSTPTAWLRSDTTTTVDP